MPPRARSGRRARRGGHIEGGRDERGNPGAEQTAGTLDTGRAGATSTHDASSWHRGGRRLPQGPGGRTPARHEAAVGG